MTQINNIHPGEVLLEEFLKPLKLSQNQLAHALKVPPRRINEIVRGLRRVTADTDLRLSKYFGTSEGYWMRLQHLYDLFEAKAKIKGALQEIHALPMGS